MLLFVPLHFFLLNRMQPPVPVSLSPTVSRRAEPSSTTTRALLLAFANHPSLLLETVALFLLRLVLDTVDAVSPLLLTPLTLKTFSNLRHRNLSNPFRNNSIQVSTALLSSKLALSRLEVSNVSTLKTLSLPVSSSRHDLGQFMRRNR